MANIEQKESDFNHMAIKHQWDKAAELKAQGVKPNNGTSYVLQHMAMNADTEGLSGMKRLGADMDADNGVALWQAVRRHDRKTVDFLLKECGADINVSDGAVLSEAIAHVKEARGDEEKVSAAGMVQYLLKKGAKANDRHLQEAVESKSLNVVDAVVSNAPGLIKSYGTIAAYEAVLAKRQDIVDYLADAGADMKQVAQGVIDHFNLQDYAQIKGGHHRIGGSGGRKTAKAKRG